MDKMSDDELASFFQRSAEREELPPDVVPQALEAVAQRARHRQWLVVGGAAVAVLSISVGLYEVSALTDRRSNPAATSRLALAAPTKATGQPTSPLPTQGPPALRGVRSPVATGPVNAATGSLSPSEPACGSSALAISAGPSGARYGRATQPILLTNASLQACSLTGFPAVAGLAGSTTVPLSAAPDGPDATRVLTPGASTDVVVSVPGGCPAAGGQSDTVYTSLQLTLPAGTVVAAGTYLDVSCGDIRVTSFGTMPQPIADNPPPPTALAANISLPAAGSLTSGFTFRMSLSNVTDSTVPLTPCPSYTFTVRLPGDQDSQSGTLDCSQRPIGPHTDRTFQIQYRPQTALTGPGGPAKVLLTLTTGVSVGGVVSMS
jgi:hypothetical protein